MIYFSFNLSNPFSHRFKNLWCYTRKLSEHKAIEIEITQNTEIVGGLISVRPKGDHAGCCLEVSLFGYSLCFEFYDTRHWDYDNNCWEKYDEQ